MKLHNRLFLSLIFIGLFSICEGNTLELLKRAEAYRKIKGSSQETTIGFQVKLIAKNNKGKTIKNKLEVLSKGKKTLVKFLEPARVKGQAMLFNDPSLWMRFPKTNRLIRISPAQRLLGQASNRDIISSDYLKDYTAQYIGEESIGNTPTHRFQLKARKSRESYQTIDYWIHKDSRKPFRAMLYAKSGKLLKIVFYKSFTVFEGREIVEKILFVDPITKGNYTLMTFSNYKKLNKPDSLFRKETLKRM